MKNNFYAMLSRMKYINRWGLMRNTRCENLCEHSLEVAYIAHALALINNKRLGGTVDPYKAAIVAMYHDTTEIMTGDMPTPVKYYNPEIRAVYGEIESNAADRLLSMLPDDFKDDYSKILCCNDDKIHRIVKAADKLSALIKCIEELGMGNNEFAAAKTSTENAVKKLDVPEANIFMQEFLPAYSLSLDEQNE